VANAKAAAECPDGNDADIGICTVRASGTPARGVRPDESDPLEPKVQHHRRTAAEASPVAAARRPARPRVTVSSADAARESFE
jgi:hypothetical protein